MTNYRPGILQEAVRKIGQRARKAAKEALDVTSNAALQKLDTSVANWKNKPGFAIIARDSGYEQRREITIFGTKKAVRIWGFVNKGTRPHIIRPKKATGYLRFKPLYQPKTGYRAKYGGSGKASGDPVFRKIVRHPGSKGRDFSGAYREEAGKQLREELIKRL